MIDLDIEPTFATARGRVSEWIDHARQWEAMWRHHDTFAAHGGGGGTSGNWPIPDAELAEMTALRRTLEVMVAMPNLARSVGRWNGSSRHQRDLVEIFNPREHLQCLLDGDRIISAFTQPTNSGNREDLGAFCYANINEEALALLQPKCFLHGWRPVGEVRPVDHFGRPAWNGSCRSATRGCAATTSTPTFTPMRKWSSS